MSIKEHGKSLGIASMGCCLILLLAIGIAGCAPVKHVPIKVPAAMLSETRPHFPIEAISTGHEGTVMLLVLVGASGQPLDIRVEKSSGYRDLDRAAIESAKHWTFRAETIDGVPKDSYVKIPVHFDLGKNKERVEEAAIHALYYSPIAQRVGSSGSDTFEWVASSRVVFNRAVIKGDASDDPRRTIFATIVTAGRGEAKLAAVWSYEKKRIYETSMQIVSNGTAATTFRVSNPNPWPLGHYRLDVEIDGAIVSTESFVITKDGLRMGG